MGTEGFERAVRENKDRIYSYAAMMLRNPADAQDVAQETMVRLWQHRHSVDQETARAWLTRTAHNLCIDRIRRLRVRNEVVPGDERPAADAGPGPLRLAASRELAALLAQAVAELPPDYRAVVILREVQCLPYDEIAAALHVPLGTVKARLHRARERLRERLVEQGVTP
jgi:RNA polymerase sigma-70 factor (ECF subfamily)